MNLHALVLPAASVATQATGVSPTAKRVPDGGEHTRVAPGQLSLKTGANETTASQRPASAATTWFVGQVIEGGWLSFTVTVNEQVCSLPLVSRAVQATVVTPLAKRVPEGGAQVVEARLQLSDGLTEKLTAASQRPASVEATILAGHVITGFSRSCTVTVKLQRLVFPLPSVATQVTVVSPMLNRVPEAGEHTTVVPAQLSLTVGEKETAASQRPASAATI